MFHALKWVFHLFFFKFVDRWERENEYWSLLRECLQPSNLLSKWPPFKSREYVIVKQKFTSCLWVVSNAFNAFHELRFFQICWALREFLFFFFSITKKKKKNHKRRSAIGPLVNSNRKPIESSKGIPILESRSLLELFLNQWTATTNMPAKHFIFVSWFSLTTLS